MTVWADEWMSDAACLGSDLFMPTVEFSARLQRAGAAKAICATCPVFPECESLALTIKPLAGVWAGVDWGVASERRGVLKRTRTRP